MALSSGAAAELLNVAPARVFFMEFEADPTTYTKWCNVETSRRAYEEAFRVSGIGSFVLKAEGTPVAYDEAVVGDRKRVLHATYALGIRIPMELMEDDQFNVVARMPSDLGEAGRDHIERLAHAPVNDGWAGATFTGMPEGDGTARSLFNTGHVNMKGGGTRSNRLSPGAALSTTSIRAAVTLMEVYSSEEGRPRTFEPAVLLIHPEERWNAAQLLDSTSEPFTADNQINPSTRNRLGIQEVRSKYLMDVDGWSMYARKGRHSVKFVRRKGITFDRGVDMDTFDRKFTAHHRALSTFDSDHGAVGSAPGT